MPLPEPLARQEAGIGPQLDAASAVAAGVQHRQRQQAHGQAAAAQTRQDVEVMQLERLGGVGGRDGDAAGQAALVALRHPEAAVEGGKGAARRPQLLPPGAIQRGAAGVFTQHVFDDRGDLPAIRVGAVANLHEPPHSLPLHPARRVRKKDPPHNPAKSDRRSPASPHARRHRGRYRR
ncbi:hypothetical protein GCM10009099_19010 [Caenispirillum bisanense]